MAPVKPKDMFVDANGIRLHYLDWGGEGPVLLFLAGMGCSAHIFSQFAPRFIDSFHVLAVDRRGHGDSDYPDNGYDVQSLTADLRGLLDALKIERVILVGHSMAYLELCRFTVLYPQRVIKLVFLDAAYDSSNPDQRAVWENNPALKMRPKWPEDGFASIQDYSTTVRRLIPSLGAIWGPVLDEEVRHSVRTTAEGKIIDKMSDAEASALQEGLKSYKPEFSSLRVPVLSFFALRDGRDFVSTDWMTPGQQQEVIEYSENTVQTYTRHWADEFRRMLPHARVVLIPNGHHYCFIKQAQLVFEEMRSFLAEP